MNQSQTWCIDGLGRLREAGETITDVSNQAIDHYYMFHYDKRSELTYACIDSYYELEMIYDKAGNMTQYYTDYNGGWHQLIYENGDMTEVDGEGRHILWNENGNVYAIGYDTNFVYNWDNKLRHAEAQYNTIDLKYDPMGNRVIRDSSVTGPRKYIVDIAGDLPTILLEVNSVDGSIMKSYVYANAEVLAQHDGNASAARYFYLHDRLGSVREVIDTNGSVVNHYTYDPFGQTVEESSTEPPATSNCFMFTGQWFDSEIGQYYLCARQYDPILMRFTGRDPERGELREPITLHKYLYCGNDPINRIDSSGRFWAEAEDAIASVGALVRVREVIYSGATWANAIFSGTMNMWFGNNSLSDSANFAIGFASGAVEMQVGLRVNARAGALAGSIIKNTATELLAKDKSLGWSAIDIAVSTALGGVVDWGGKVKPIEMFMLGIDSQLILWDLQGGMSQKKLNELLESREEKKKK